MKLKLLFSCDITAEGYHIVNTSINSHLLFLLSYYLGVRLVAVEGSRGSQECKILQSLRH